MADVSLTKALSAYGDAVKVGENLSNPAAAALETKENVKPEFTELLGEALDRAMGAGYKGETVQAKSIANQADLHDLVLAVGNAELTLNTVVAIRDRVISAYQDIIKMPI